METKKVINTRLDIDNSQIFVSNLDIDSQDTKNKTVVLTIDHDDDENDETPRDLDLVETDKFIAKSDGDWELGVYINYIKDFERREEFDEWSFPKRLREHQESVDKISFKDAMLKIGVEFSLSKNYYLEHQDEIENDLNRKLTNSENLTDKFPDKELLYKQLCKLFVENSSTNNEYDYILEDFHYFENMGYNTTTAKQGEYYLHFKYYTS